MCDWSIVMRPISQSFHSHGQWLDRNRTAYRGQIDTRRHTWTPNTSENSQKITQNTLFFFIRVLWLVRSYSVVLLSLISSSFRLCLVIRFCEEKRAFNTCIRCDFSYMYLKVSLVFPFNLHSKMYELRAHAHPYILSISFTIVIIKAIINTKNFSHPKKGEKK